VARKQLVGNTIEWLIQFLVWNPNIEIQAAIKDRACIIAFASSEPKLTQTWNLMTSQMRYLDPKQDQFATA